MLDFLDKVAGSFTLQEAKMSKTVLQIRVGQALKQVQANTSVVVTAEQSAVYQLVWADTNKAVDDVVLRRKGDALLIEADGQPEVRIEKFFQDGALVAYDLGTTSGAGASPLVTPDAVAAADTGIVWQPGNSAGAIDASPGISSGGFAGLFGGGAVLLASDDDNKAPIDVPEAPNRPTFGNFPTDDTTPVIIGFVDAKEGERLSLTVNGATYDDIPYDDATGRWSLDTEAATPSSGSFSPFEPGFRSFTATLTNEAGISTSAEGELIITDPTIVVFDLINGASSEHSFINYERVFNPDYTYTIYVIVDGRATTTESDDWNIWKGGENLGYDDKVVLVTSDELNSFRVRTDFGNGTIRWGRTENRTDYKLTSYGSFLLYGESQLVQLWSATDGYEGAINVPRTAPGAFAQWTALPVSQVVRTTIPSPVLTTQGMA